MAIKQDFNEIDIREMFDSELDDVIGGSQPICQLTRW